MARRHGGAPPVSADDSRLFRDAIGEVRPLPDDGRASVSKPRRTTRPPPASPVPAAADPLSDHAPWADEDIPAAWSRPGLTRQTLRKLRRGEWPVGDEIDLHGLTVAEARPCLFEFVRAARARDLRCVRVIHGKGLSSPGGAPVLRQRVRAWLAQIDAVLAYCPAPPADGGDGALLALLKAAP